MRAVLHSERARLTALYGTLLVLAGGGLVALVNVLLRKGLGSRVNGAVTTVMPGVPVRAGDPLPDETAFVPAQKLPPGVAPTDAQLARWAATKNVSRAAEQAALHELTVVSLVALALFAVLSVWLAWWMAGRVLRPVGVITEKARRLSGANLHERIALQGPPGELKRLADTFDGMLDRMEGLVTAQRRFAANAAHELRTPVAVQRAAAEIGLAGDPGPQKVARIRERLIAVADSSEHLIESLLLLAVSEEGLESAEPVDLAALAETELAAVFPPGGPSAGPSGGPSTGPSAGSSGGPTAGPSAEPTAGPTAGPGEAPGEVSDAAPPAPPAPTVVRDLAPLTVSGDGALLGHLVRNLLANAVRHNRGGGRVSVVTSADGVLTVSNTGPQIAAADVPRLLEPFRRRAERRHTAGEGAGLGLSIVASIARAHGAELLAEANPEPAGGLTVRVRFPVAPGPGRAGVRRD
ncbi:MULTISPECIES: ATP-binding protein [unclassified Streptomyces]|uniref:ATP-binding protein n=1 Tax=unclassified Streptomyces TaxID=2593676 RepID=UPI0029A5A3BE|nr:ATP-binding protein [Streptomyces sp. DK15]MDX2392484.1 ATP-binding protein [Streptomyces sp. DK15]